MYVIDCSISRSHNEWQRKRREASSISSKGRAYETKPTFSLKGDDAHLVWCARSGYHRRACGGLWQQYDWIGHHANYNPNDKQQRLWRWQLRQGRNDSDRQHFWESDQDGIRHSERLIGNHSYECPGFDPLLPNLRCAAVDRL